MQRYRTAQTFSDWQTAVNWWGNKENRQIQWDRLYYANRQAAANGEDALYYLQAKHNDAMTTTLSSTLTNHLGKNKVFNAGAFTRSDFSSSLSDNGGPLGCKEFHKYQYLCPRNLRCS